ncbi:hypothetical protein [Microbacterium rhizophilus]|uniref:hypothetical protein n=1 Tax=Microbacterium rhizophilus TaxID=3138934 RepID=UPI0031F0D86C
MTRSDDQGCIRGCMADHFAACPAYGNPEGTCPGCAPAPRVDGTLICDRCYRRLRFLLHSASDILGRMRTLAQQGKAVVYSAAPASSGSGAPDQVDADLLEATHVVAAKLKRWGGWIRNGRATLDAALSDEGVARDLIADLLELHERPADADESYTGWPIAEWTLADAHARWGIERRDRYVYPAEEEPGVVVVTPVREWYDPLLQFADAAKRAGISERQLRTWVKDEVIEPVAKLRTAGVLRDKRGRSSQGQTIVWFKASDIDAAAAVMAGRQAATRLRRHAEEAMGSA